MVHQSAVGPKCKRNFSRSHLFSTKARPVSRTISRGIIIITCKYVGGLDESPGHGRAIFGQAYRNKGPKDAQLTVSIILIILIYILLT